MARLVVRRDVRSRASGIVFSVGMRASCLMPNHRTVEPLYRTVTAEGTSSTQRKLKKRHGRMAAGQKQWSSPKGKTKKERKKEKVPTRCHADGRYRTSHLVQDRRRRLDEERGIAPRAKRPQGCCRNFVGRGRYHLCYSSTSMG